MVTKLQTQLENSVVIKSPLKDVPFSFKPEHGRDAKVLLVYLAVHEGRSFHQAFFEKVKEGILANFVFKCSYIKRKLDVENSKTPEELFEQAVRKLSQHTAKGELGESKLHAGFKGAATSASDNLKKARIIGLPSSSAPLTLSVRQPSWSDKKLTISITFCLSDLSNS